MKKVILLEDDPGTSLRLGKIIQRRGIDVLFASDTSTALEIWDNSKAEIDGVISDFNLHKKTAANFLSIVKEDRPDTLLILMSGSVPGIIPSETLGIVNFYFTKPVSVDELLNALFSQSRI